MKISPVNRVLIIGGALLCIIGFLFVLQNFSGFVDDMPSRQGPGSFDDFSKAGAGFFQSHIWSMGLIFIGGTLSTLGIIRALIAKFGDGKAIDKALETVGGTKIGTYHETVHGNKIGNVSQSTISIGDHLSSGNATQPQLRKSRAQLADHFISLIRENKPEECLHALTEHFTTVENSKALGESVLLARRLKENEQTFHKGTEHSEELRREREKIVGAIMALIEEELKPAAR